MIGELYNFTRQHTVAAMGAVHLAHLGWARAKAAWPGIKAALVYCHANGGIVRTAIQFLWSNPTSPADPSSLAKAAEEKPHNPS